MKKKLRWLLPISLLLVASVVISIAVFAEDKIPILGGAFTQEEYEKITTPDQAKKLVAEKNELVDNHMIYDQIYFQKLQDTMLPLYGQNISDEELQSLYAKVKKETLEEMKARGLWKEPSLFDDFLPWEDTIAVITPEIKADPDKLEAYQTGNTNEMYFYLVWINSLYRHEAGIVVKENDESQMEADYQQALQISALVQNYCVLSDDGVLSVKGVPSYEEVSLIEPIFTQLQNDPSEEVASLRLHFAPLMEVMATVYAGK